MALLKTLALAGVFTAAAAAGIYTYTPPKPQPHAPEVAAPPTELFVFLFFACAAKKSRIPPL